MAVSKIECPQHSTVVGDLFYAIIRHVLQQSKGNIILNTSCPITHSGVGRETPPDKDSFRTVHSHASDLMQQHNITSCHITLHHNVHQINRLITSHCITLHYITLYHIASHYTTLHHITSYHILYLTIAEIQSVQVREIGGHFLWSSGCYETLTPDQDYSPSHTSYLSCPAP
jgi:hypothetical protein